MFAASPTPAGGLLQGFPRGVAGPFQGTPPLARFLPEELAASTPSLQYREGAYFLGVIGGEVHTERAANRRLLRWVRKGQALGYITDKHLLTIAPNRSDKGRACVNTNALLYPGSMFLSSAKDDLIRETLPRRAQMLGQRCLVFAPFHDLPGFEAYRTRFNCLSILQPDSPTLIEDSDLIADALIVLENDKEAHWGEKARSFVGRGLILHVATHPKFDGGRDLVAVYDLLMGRDANLQEDLLSNTAAEGAVIDAARDFYDTPENERGSILSTARRHLAFLAYPQIQKVLVGDGPDLRDFKRETLTFYTALPATRLATCGRLFRLLMQMILAALERETAKPQYPVRLVMDEFAAYDRLAVLEKAVGQIAGLDCQLHIILQDLSQLNALYGARAESFLANAGLIQSFACADNTTLRWLSERLGATTILSPSLDGAAGDWQKGLQPASWHGQSHPLLTPEELSRCFGQQDERLRQLVIIPGLHPLVLQRAYYDKHELFVRP